MKTFFDATDNCDETFLFAYHKQTVASIHIGAGLGKRTVASAIEAVVGRLQTGDSVGNQTVAQVCGGGKGPKILFGLSIDTTNSSCYIAYAEVNEIIRGGGGQLIHDSDSDTDVLLYQGLQLLFPLQVNGPIDSAGKVEPLPVRPPRILSFWGHEADVITLPRTELVTKAGSNSGGGIERSRIWAY